ncbi:hypothetical protein [Anaeromicropila populeti]|uniref:Uncharacterized protein n=1 Tax=Anaeromicropila populeti TaxID=37658 RepID=A0A1I6L083_9FIRM|nr:hypothetical protein [Anaeromicropila populeti]SFR96889.1 hypothetical protein SAMN05661086_02945 [Anaeromicropila populeti]
MKKKTSLIVLMIFIVLAILIGFVLVNKGDGPVSGMILADKVLDNIDEYNSAEETQGSEIYLVVSSAYNKLEEEYKTSIPESENLYATIHIVECPKGSEFTGKWLKDDEVIKEDVVTLATDSEGVVTCMLDGDNVTKGSYSFELYEGDRKILEKTFSVE